MWKRENEPNSPNPAPVTPPVAPRREPDPPPVRAAEAPSAPVSTGRALIGAGTIVRGEIAGEEDLLVEGRVEGKIDLRQNAVTVGAKGRLAAEVRARTILIDGEVDGNLHAEEQIVIRKTGRVRGDLSSPRVTIEDGARFKGAIDMEPKRAAPPAAAGATVGAPRPAVTGKPDPIAATLAAAASGTNG